YFFFSSKRRHTRSKRDWSSDVCSSDLGVSLWMECRYLRVVKRATEAMAEILTCQVVVVVTNAINSGSIVSSKCLFCTLRCGVSRSEERRVGKERRYRW